MEKLELEPHLNTCFRHFMLFTLVGAGGCWWLALRGAAQQGQAAAQAGWRTPTAEHLCQRSAATSPSLHPPAHPTTHPPQEFNLIDERELAPLKELIDRMVR